MKKQKIRREEGGPAFRRLEESPFQEIMSRKKMNPILLITVLMLGIFVFASGLFGKLSKDPSVTGIRADFNGLIRPGEPFNADMFIVKGITEDSRLVPLKNFTVTSETAATNGGTCETIITAQGHEVTAIVPITREEVASLNIGYPYKEDVKVTFYSNGDLEFTGTGDVQNFGDIPWKEYEYTHVYFDGNLTITKMDQWFKGSKTLTYIDSLPKTVKSIKEMASGCELLKDAPEYFQCQNLKVMDNAFWGCSLIENVDVLPVNVTSAKYAFSGCVSLQNPCDMGKTSNLIDISGIHSGCTSLRNVPEIPETVAVMDESFKGCINIQYAAKFPQNVQSIREAYANCTSLETASTIPEKAKDISQCYIGCNALSGTLEINTDTKNFAGVLRNAATMGDILSISGNSGNLLAIQQDSGNSDIVLADPKAAANQNKRMLAEELATK